ncbi:hypothetical protein GKC56_08225 [Neisseriaceae bacterium PsAf]|nr:hypothetical protein [Neisseriaceae bacterium PsAf]MCV2502967.1 CNP1-like family protein [Neisseriaceae bacterium]
MKKIMIYMLTSAIMLSCSTTKDLKPIDFRDTTNKTNDEKNLFFPDINDSEWAPLSLYDTTQNDVFILLNSVYTSSDLTNVNYYMNIKTPDGFNNVTAERINCSSATYQSLAIADLNQQSWIYQKDTSAKSLDNTLNSLDTSRKNLYKTFCNGVFPKSKQELKKRL